ncbi:MAG: hypothetical protein ACRDK0_02315 [Solirubrobacteraceae bacterium]
MRTIPRRAAVLAAALACATAGCGSESDYANKPRPATPINVTAAVSDRGISVSPKTFGAGPIVLIVSNQTDSAQTVTLETEELAGSKPGIRQTTSPIDPRGTATLKVDVRRGTYAVSTRGRGISPATVEVGAARRSAQDELLQP